MRDDIATTTGGNLPADSAGTGVTRLGGEVFQSSTTMAGAGKYELAGGPRAGAP